MTLETLMLAVSVEHILLLIENKMVLVDTGQFPI